jgi:hypothetical protein
LFRLAQRAGWGALDIPCAGAKPNLKDFFFKKKKKKKQVCKIGQLQEQPKMTLKKQILQTKIFAHICEFSQGDCMRSNPPLQLQFRPSARLSIELKFPLLFLSVCTRISNLDPPPPLDPNFRYFWAIDSRAFSTFYRRKRTHYTT